MFVQKLTSKLLWAGRDIKPAYNREIQEIVTDAIQCTSCLEVDSLGATFEDLCNELELKTTFNDGFHFK